MVQSSTVKGLAQPPVTRYYSIYAGSPLKSPHSLIGAPAPPYPPGGPLGEGAAFLLNRRVHHMAKSRAEAVTVIVV